MTAPRRPQDLWAAFDFPRHPLAREDGERLRGAFFAPPAERLIARDPDRLRAVLRLAHAAARAGAWVLGGLRYEAAGALDAVLRTRPAGEAPLAEFHVWHDAPEAWPEALAAQGASRAHPMTAWRDTQDESDEQAQVERIREYIRQGDCYQVNLTTRLGAEALDGFDEVAYFFALHASQPGGFSMFLRTGDGSGDDIARSAVASVSPELFFDWRPLPETPQASHTWLLSAQPMKGTAPRGRDRAGDEAAQAHLRTSAKERAENLMIVDLLRNDLSRVAVPGSVRVPRLFELHALPTVWQMTSTIGAVTRGGLALDDVMTALFPCGSITGAPKKRAMEVVDELEPGPRGWYCGALGLLQPGGAVTFNVPIRTVEQTGRALRCGVGSGITLDSQPRDEIDEWRAKVRFLTRALAPVEALETMRLEDGEFARDGRHLTRMQRTARHFGLTWSADAAKARLVDIARRHPQGAWRVRLTLARDGTFNDMVQALPAPTDRPEPLTVALARTPIDTRGPAAEFIQHKTTRREVYQAFLDAKPADCFDVLLFNRDGELTEGCLTNLALQRAPDGPWLTPRAEAGLLPGTLREELLEQGRLREARLTLDDLRRAHALAIFNGVRGWREVRLRHEDSHDDDFPTTPPRGAQDQGG
ncbi:chorismate-binding protein [Mitsuaria sp. 7]|uniref:chorismate-binding protein n=1 Tax=Mitsuaria sp. 7 TaxID=1658665 RepID=UPI000834FA55|nr:bifunctional anthranilate synthase component I family protein/class IV aminotransferase [Mitsuaria sp. 7]